MTGIGIKIKVKSEKAYQIRNAEFGMRNKIKDKRKNRVTSLVTCESWDGSRITGYESRKLAIFKR